MRRDLVEEILADVADELFEDVLYTPTGGGAAVLVENAIFGVEPYVERFDVGEQAVRGATHVTRALKSKFPALARGDTIKDGTAPAFADGTTYKVLDFQPPEDGDGRLETVISLAIV